MQENQHEPNHGRESQANAQDSQAEIKRLMNLEFQQIMYPKKKQPIDEINPLVMGIEDIINIGTSKQSAAIDEAKTGAGEPSDTAKIAQSSQELRLQMRTMLGDQMESNEKETLLENLFEEKIDTQSWLHSYHKKPKVPGFIQHYIKDDGMQATPRRERSPDALPKETSTVREKEA